VTAANYETPLDILIGTGLYPCLKAVTNGIFAIFLCEEV
jgi:hypothetical protein